MYLSRVQRRPGGTLTATYKNPPLADPYEEHAFIWSLFEKNGDIERDFLYRRVDEQAGSLFYVLSKRKPQEGDEHWAVESKRFEPVIEVGDRFHFSFRANPVITKKPEGNTSKKRKRDDVFMNALAEYKDVPASQRPTNAEILTKSAFGWLEQRAQSNGFHVTHESVLVEGYRKVEMVKRSKKDSIQFGVVDYSGVLEVTNVGLFYKALNQGIGKSRAFGCGLLLIKRAGP